VLFITMQLFYGHTRDVQKVYATRLTLHGGLVEIRDHLAALNARQGIIHECRADFVSVSAQHSFSTGYRELLEGFGIRLLPSAELYA
jgi:hypothetical protein